MSEAGRTRTLVFPMYLQNIVVTILCSCCCGPELPPCGAWEKTPHPVPSVEGGTGESALALRTRPRETIRTRQHYANCGNNEMRRTRCRLALKRVNPWFSIFFVKPHPKPEKIRASVCWSVFLLKKSQARETKRGYDRLLHTLQEFGGIAQTLPHA